MKICHLILCPRLSGAEVVVGDLLRLQAARGHEVVAVSLEPPEPSFEASVRAWEESARLYFPTLRSGGAPIKQLRRFAHVRRALVDAGPDVVFAHTVIPSAYARLARPPGMPVVTVLHAQDDFACPRHRWFERRVLPRPAAVVCVSRLGASNYASRLRRGQPIVIPNGVDLNRIERARQARDRVRFDLLGSEAQAALVLQVGRFVPLKRQLESVQAFGSLVRAGTPAVLAFAGIHEDVRYRASVEREATRNGSCKRVLFLGPRMDVPELLAAADLVLMPSVYEAHSVALLEALASGSPVVASDIPAFQFARSYEGVCLVDPSDLAGYADAMTEAVLACPNRFRRPLAEFSAGSMVDAYDAVCGGVVPCR